MRSKILLLFLLSTAVALQAQNPARPIMEKMMHQMDNVLSVSARVKRLERMVDGDMVSGEMEFKAMFEPNLKAYVRIISPREGTEVLYVEGWNDNSALINPNGFPWINVSLDPQGSHMMEKQHHSLLCIGFRYTESVVKDVYNRSDTDFDEHVFYMGEQKWYDRNTYVIKIVYNEYGTSTYTVKQGEESLCEIERKIFVPAAKMLELNPNVDDYWDIKPGQVIKVPNKYGKESIFMIDSETYLPIVQIVHDDKGLFEKYEYHDLKVNPRFTTTEFTTEFPGYGF